MAEKNICKRQNAWTFFLSKLRLWIGVCRQTKREYKVKGGLGPYLLLDSQVQYHLQAYCACPYHFRKRWSHTSRVICSGIPFVAWNLCKNSYQVPEMILKKREKMLRVEFPKSAIVTKLIFFKNVFNSLLKNLLLPGMAVVI